MADKVIQVNVTSTKSQRVSVSPGNVQNEISATPDSSQYYSNLAKNWAIASGLILNEDYSSKHYANESAKSASSAKNYADASQATYTNVQNVANEALTNIEDARVDAVDNITTVKGESIASVEAKSNEANALVNTGIAEINNTKTNAVNAVTTTKNNAVTEINKEVTDGKKELNDIIEAGGLNINDKITNCLLEAPQNIKLELNNGTLTLKAGSKVIVPNGVGVFDEVEITKDLSTAFDNNNQKMVFLNPARNAINHCNVVNQQSSGASSTSTSSYNFWYDTTNNYVKFTNNSGSTWTSGFSLPICLVTKDSGIDQVFNGMGYIGSTRWIDKGVKFLAPNGRNEDGTLNNYECVVPEITLRTRTDKWSGKTLLAYYFDGNSADWTYDLFTESDVEPTPTASTWRWFNTKENKIYYTTDGGATWKTHVAPIAILGANSFTSGVITSLSAKLPFRAVDYNDFNKSITALSKAYITETYVSGKSGYNVYSNGYCEQWGYWEQTDAGTITITLIKSYNSTDFAVYASPHLYRFVTGLGGTSGGYAISNNTIFLVQDTDNANGIYGTYWRTAGYIS